MDRRLVVTVIVLSATFPWTVGHCEPIHYGLLLNLLPWSSLCTTDGVVGGAGLALIFWTLLIAATMYWTDHARQLVPVVVASAVLLYVLLLAPVSMIGSCLHNVSWGPGVWLAVCAVAIPVIDRSLSPLVMQWLRKGTTHRPLTGMAQDQQVSYNSYSYSVAMDEQKEGKEVEHIPQPCRQCSGTRKVSCTACGQSGRKVCPDCYGSSYYNYCYGCQKTGRIACPSCWGSGNVTCYSC